MQQQYQQQRQIYREPEYKVKPTWSLAWGLLWRMWILCIPVYIIALIMTTI